MDKDDTKKVVKKSTRTKKDTSKKINELNETVKDLIENEKVPINKVCEIFKMSRYKIKKILENK